MDDVKAVAAGSYSTAVVKTNGSLWVLENYQSEEKINMWYDVVSVATNGSATMAVTSDGDLLIWGWDPAIEMGGYIDDYEDMFGNEPTYLILDDVVSVSTGLASFMFIKKDGSLWGWGWNGYGQVGDGTNTRYIYAPVKIMDDVSSVSAADYHTIAVKNDGSLWAWGKGDYLGDGTMVDKYSPIKIMDDVSSISASDGHNIALKNDGSIWTWGYNGYGQLGDGTIQYRFDPVEVFLSSQPAVIVTIISQPTDIRVVEDRITESLSVEVSVSPADTVLSYQWYEIGDTFMFIETAVPGATESTFIIPPDLTAKVIATDWYYPYKYFCVISVEGAVMARSEVANVYVEKPDLGIAPHITFVTLQANAVIGYSYSGSFTASGTAPISWDIANGTLPPGLSLSSDGYITGTPTTTGTFNFTVRATNAAGSDTTSRSITVTAAPIITTSSVPFATVGLSYSFTFAASGTSPITWSVDSGSLPPGLTLNATTGMVSGTPTTPGTYEFLIRATNAVGYSTGTAGIIVSPPIINITTQPASSTTVTAGNITGSLYVAASVTPGATLSYQWYRNTSNSNIGGTAVPGATGATYNIPTNLTGGNYFYYCEVNATGGATTRRSNIALIKVQVETNFYLHPVGKSIKLNVNWSDDYFSKSANTGGNDLAIASLALCEAAHRENDNDVKNTLSAMGFGDFDSHYWSENLNTIAYIIARKTTIIDGKTCDIVAVVCRGTKGTLEWVSNILYNHQGFAEASYYVRDSLTWYLISRGLDTQQDIKFLITGHSRGAAVANLLSAQIIRQYAICNADNVYTYCFAPPAAAPIPAFGAPDKLDYNNSGIINLANADDLVCKVPPFGFLNGFVVEFTPSTMPELLNTFKQLTGIDYNKKSAEHYHAPVTYLAWLLQNRSLTTGTRNGIKIVSIKCPVDVEIYNEAGIIVGRVTGSVIDETLGTEVLVLLDGDEKTVILPNDGEYTIKLIGTDNGMLNFSVGYADPDTWEMLEYKEFRDVSLYEGKLMVSSVNDIASVKFFVTDSNGTPIAEINIDGSETPLSLDRSVSIKDFDVPIQVVNGVAVLEIDKTLLFAIVNADGNQIIVDLIEYNAVDFVMFDVTWMKDYDKTFTFITANGSFDVKTKTIWNNSGKTRVVGIRNTVSVKNR